MVRNNTEYGIDRIPRSCMAYYDGFRYVAAVRDLATGETTTTQFFRCWAEAKEFTQVNLVYRSY